MVRMILLPLRLLLFPFRFAAGSAKAGYVAGRAVGLSRSIFFGLGFASGVLVASPEGPQGRVRRGGSDHEGRGQGPGEGRGGARRRTGTAPVVVPDLVVAAPARRGARRPDLRRRR